ncbi:MAG: acyl-CoA dehydrogenase family protein [Alphaproteobacteria bacterium]|nr:acyl-CoA dehydrogenase family protein [Alphaproteobacteria bacterium]
MDIEVFAHTHLAGRDLLTRPDFPHDLWQEMASAGLFRVGLDPRYGGAGGGYAAIARADAALIGGSGVPGLGSAWASHQMVAHYFIEGFGSDAQRATFLPGLASGEMTASVAISEPGAGAHPKHLTTTAACDGNEYVLDGEKAYITNGPIADLFVILAITAVENGRKRYSMFIVPQHTPGLSRVAMKDIPSLRPALHSGLRLTSCAVPAANRLGPEHRAYETMALPFRDVEDAVGSAGLVAGLRHMLGRLAGSATADDVGELGALAALIGLMSEASNAIVAALDATAKPAREMPALVGIRVLATEMLVRMQRFRDDRGINDDRLLRLFESLETSLGVARMARTARLLRLGEALLKRP